MPRFVLEIGTEEMPARFLAGLDRELAAGFTRELENGRVDFGRVSTYSTPRRLCVMVEDMAETTRLSEELITGPPARAAYDKEGAPTKAAQGFARTHGVDLDQTFIQETEKGEYLAVRKKTGGEAAAELLPEICVQAVSGLPFPKKMRWGSRDFAYGRSIRWFLCLLGDKTIKFELAEIQSSNLTFGHRVMGPGPWKVDKAEDYLSVLKDKAGVILDAAERKEIIVAAGDKLAQEAGGRVVWNDSLLSEVTGLVEYPLPILGGFDPSFLELPREALLTSMQNHQKSFGLENSKGDLLPYFLTTLNIEPKDVGLVRKGWERVLKARLEDARFFWKTDLSRDFEDWLSQLDNVVFLGPLGSMGDKSRRIEAMSDWLARELGEVDPAVCARGGRLAKADLVSEMVGEFAELQGIMGGIYAREKGETQETARAVYEHYLPAGHESPIPESLPGCVVSMADKADTLAGCFGLDMIPTGANDPYALRRNALGICRIIMEKGLRLDLAAFLGKAVDLYSGCELKLGRDEILTRLMDFFAQRLKNLFISQGRPTLVAEAAIGAGISDLRSLKARVEALSDFSREPDFERAVLTFKRAGNIIFKQGGEAGQELDGNYDKSLFQEDQEKGLARSLEQAAGRFETLWAGDDYPALFRLLGELRPSVDDFFDHVMVMCEEPDLRLNRLNLLKSLVDRLGRLADFRNLQV